MKKLNFLILLLILGATIALFFLLGPEEKQTLFYVNLILTLIVEGGVLTTLFLTESKYNLQNLAVAGPILYGAGAIVLWMIVYTLLMRSWVDTTWYYAGLIVIAVISTLVVVFTKQGGTVQQQVNIETKNAVSERNVVSLDVRMLKADLEEAVRMKDMDATLRREALTKLQLFIDKVTMTPAFDLQRNQLLNETIRNGAEQMRLCIGRVQATGTKEETEQVLIQLRDLTNSTIAKLEILKK